MHSIIKCIPIHSFIDIMGNCLLNKQTNDDPSIYDHRYFYIKDKIGHYTCGLARGAITDVLRSYGEDIFLDSVWLDSLVTFKNNPPVLGFIIEQACLSSISQKGLKIAGLGFNNMKAITYTTKIPTYDKCSSLTLYIPFAYNYKAIDGLILEITNDEPEDKENKCGVVRLIPIQITIAKEHSDSESNFFARWNDWENDLQEYEIQYIFLWITENIRESNEVELNQKKLRSKRDWGHPKYNNFFVTIEDVNKDISRKLEIARGKCNQS
jgi:hypothetical protein